MLKKVIGEKIELLPKTPKENEKLCDTCRGTGWLLNSEKGCITKCRDCYDGVIHLCSNCQQPTKYGSCRDMSCKQAREEKAEQIRFDRAIKIKYDDVPLERKVMLYSDSYGYNEGYFSEPYELVEYCQDEGIDIPKYAWSTTKIGLSMDADCIIDMACEDLHEDARDNIVGEDELQKFLDAWCAKQSGVDTYVADYEYAVYIEESNDE